VADLALRVLVSIAAGAMLRMLSVFGVIPMPFAVVMLAVVGAFFSKGLQAARFMVVVATSGSYFVAWLYTQSPASAQVMENPDFFDLVRGGIEVFAPFLTPVIGSGIMLAIEKHRRGEPVEEEITEDSLLSEKLPEVPERDMYYNLGDSE
jgi:hypothetical protein